VATIIELRMCDDDRKKYGGQEWIPLDIDRLLDTPASMLKRWELETNYPVELAIDKAGSGAPAVVTQTLVWLARKQTGEGSDEDTGQPETFARLNDLKTMRVSVRRAAQPEADAVPPGGVFVAGMEQPEPTPQP
jgi:hypothetical protein